MAPLHTLLRVVLVYFLAILDAAATPFRHNITALGSLNGTNRTHGMNGTISNTALYRQFKLPVSSSSSDRPLTLSSSLSVATEAVDAAPDSSSAENLSSITSPATPGRSWETRYRAPFQTPSNSTGSTNFGSSAARIALHNATFPTPTGTRQHTLDTNSTAKLSLKTSHREPLWVFNWNVSESANHAITPAVNQSHVPKPHMIDRCLRSHHSDMHKTELNSTLNARSLPYEPMDTGYSVNMTHLQWIYKPVNERHGNVFPVADSAAHLQRRRLGHKEFCFDAEDYFSFDIHYPKELRPYNDFACDPDEPEMPDREYYYFCEKNIADSKVFDWYASWTAAIQNDWTFEQFGEWGAFAYYFMNTQNFGCGIGMGTCKEGLTLYEIQQMYPGARDRPLVRRIYFTHMIYEQAHSWDRALLEAVQTAGIHMATVAEDIVTHFTLQVDPTKELKCAIINELVNQIQSSAINLCGKLFFSAVVPELMPVLNLVKDPLKNKYDAWLNSDSQSSGRRSRFKKFLKNPKEKIKDAILTPILTPLKDMRSYMKGEVPKHIEAAAKEAAANMLAHPDRSNPESPPDLGAILRWSKFDNRKIQKDQREEIKKIKRINRWIKRHPGKDVQEFYDKKSYRNHRKAYLKENPKGSLSNVAKNTVQSFIWNNVVTNTNITTPILGLMVPKKLTTIRKSDRCSVFTRPALPALDGGHSKGGLCAEWEGDFTDQNPENIKKLKLRVHTIFANTRTNIQEIFRSMYDGLKVPGGGPTVGARWLQSMPFTGNNSLTYFMDNMAEAERIVDINAAKDIISSTLGSDFNFIKCGNLPDALKICANNKRIGKEQSWAKAIFCPRPESEPTKICAAVRWYMGEWKSHEAKMVAIDTVEKFNDGVYGFKLEQLLLESYESYKEMGNTKSEELEGQAFKALEEKKFHMPVCEYEGPKLMTVFKGVPLDHGWELWSDPKPYNWEFPPICGNHAANETAIFLEALGLGKESKYHTEPDHCDPKTLNEVFNDFIPRQLRKSDDPYTTYMALCGANIRFPSNDLDNNCPIVDWRIREGADKDCDLIREGSLGMNIEEANRWFCLNEGNHSVFEREWSHADFTYNPVGYWRSHRKRCSTKKFDKPPPRTVTPVAEVAEDSNKKAWEAFEEEFKEVREVLSKMEKNAKDGKEREEYKKIDKELDEEEQKLKDGEKGEEDGDEVGGEDKDKDKEQDKEQDKKQDEVAVSKESSQPAESG